MPIHKRKHKLIELDIDGNRYEGQIREWELENNTDDGDPVYTFAPDGEGREDVEPEWQLNLTFFSDWRSEGISDYLMLHDGETATFVIDNHPDIAAEHTRLAGSLVIKAPNIGGEARENEEQEAELQVIGKPLYSRPSAGGSGSGSGSGSSGSGS